jgi:hypothetical protein
MKFVKLFEDFGEENPFDNMAKPLRDVIKGDYQYGRKASKIGNQEELPEILGTANTEEFISMLDSAGELSETNATVCLLQAVTFGRVEIVKHLLSIHTYKPENIELATQYTELTRKPITPEVKSELLSILSK